MMMKVVYYGPALAGKTTNLKSLHLLAPPGRAGRLMNLEPREMALHSSTSACVSKPSAAWSSN